MKKFTTAVLALFTLLAFAPLASAQVTTMGADQLHHLQPKLFLAG